MERHIRLHIIITLFLFFFFFFSNICDYIKEGPVLLLLFPSLSLSPLIGPLKYGVCVCCLVLFVLSGCYVVMLCVKKIMTTKKIVVRVLLSLVFISTGNYSDSYVKVHVLSFAEM